MYFQLKQTEIYEIWIRPAIAIYVLHEIKCQANIVTGTCMSKNDIINIHNVLTFKSSLNTLRLSSKGKPCKAEKWTEYM